MNQYSVSQNVLAELRTFQTDHNWKTNEINVLDWGCGRGRTVAKLRELGFNAFGIEIDKTTMQNGFQLFQNRDMNPTEVLRHVDDVGSFPEGFFHFVCSEQVFEHVADLNTVVAELARVTAVDGVGVHNFPSARCVMEEHLFMPFVHWLPKNLLRKVAIRLMLSLGQGPKPDWPEASGKTATERAQVYFDYTVQRTFYRDIRDIVETFMSAGFEANATVGDNTTTWKRLLFPGYLNRNGFPNLRTTLITQRIHREECENADPPHLQ
ncbi:MAG: class I SAM-dependent methyltransferase [Fuerstiella sp.]|nr:class I SAM-dependent methyltransferase [Fuerstiella sp.]